MKPIFLIPLVWFGLLPAPTAAAKDATATVSPALYQQLQKIDRLRAEQHYAQAEQRLQAALKTAKAGSYEEAVVWRSRASVAAQRHQYAQAADWLQRALALKVLPDEQAQKAVFNLGQLYLAAGRYAQAIETLTPWLARHPRADASTHALIANAYAQLKRYRPALAQINQALRLSPKPVIAWYQLQLALNDELKDYPAARRSLKTLLRLQPDHKRYWLQLASLYQYTRDYRQAATVQQLAYRKGLLTTEQELLDLGQLLRYIGAPYQAAELLQRELRARRIAANAKHWELVANAWTEAHELKRAVAALTRAAEMDAQGRRYEQLGRLHYEQEHWPAAIDALTKALAKGGLKDPGRVYLLLGICHFERHDLKHAHRAWQQAKRYRSAQAAAAQWLRFSNQ